MSFINKFKDLMLGAEVEEDYEYESEEYMEEPKPINRTEFINSKLKKPENNNNNANNVVNMPNVHTPQRECIVICRPKTIDDAPIISNSLSENMMCIVSLEGVDSSNAQRIADFLGGSAYSLSCTVDRISDTIFVIAPSHVDVTSQMKADIKEEMGKSSILPWISSTFR